MPEIGEHGDTASVNDFLRRVKWERIKGEFNYAS